MYSSYMQRYQYVPQYSNQQTMDLMRTMRDREIELQRQYNNPTMARDVQALQGAWNNAMQTAQAQGWRYPINPQGGGQFSMQAPMVIPNFMGGDEGTGYRPAPFGGHSFSPYSGMTSPFPQYNNGDMTTQQGGVVGPNFKRDAWGAVARIGDAYQPPNFAPMQGDSRYKAMIPQMDYSGF